MIEKIVVKGSEGELNNVKQLLRSFKESDNSLSIGSLRFGNLGDETLLSFNVDKEHYNFLIEKFSMLGVKLLLPEEKLNNIVSKLKSKVEFVQSKKNTSKNPSNESPSSTLEASIKLGDYEKVIQMSKDFRHGIDIITKAKDNIDLSIKSAIDNAYRKAINNKFEINDSFTKLIKIASDNKLKTLHKNEYLKEAGLLLVELCYAYKEYINLLVQICNNNSIPNLVNIKAAIKLAEFINDSSEDQKDNIEYLGKYLNIKWLLIAFDVAYPELTFEEKETFSLLIKIVRETKEKKN